MHIFTEHVAKYLSLKMLIFGLSWLEHSPSIMSIVFIKKKNATALQQRCCFFPFNTSIHVPLLLSLYESISYSNIFVNPTEKRLGERYYNVPKPGYQLQWLLY